MSPRLKRYKLLLDEMLPRREKLPLMNSSHDLKHIVHDLRKGGLNDEQIIDIAKSQNRLVITKNIKHFQDLCKNKGVDMIGITEALLPEYLDKKIMAHLRRRKVKKMTGKVKKLIYSPRK